MERRMLSAQLRRASRRRWALSRSTLPAAGKGMVASHAAASIAGLRASGVYSSTTLSCGGGGRSGPVRVTRSALGSGKVSVYSKPGKVALGPETSLNSCGLALGAGSKPESSRSTVTIVSGVS
jgi:hypothetical protein